MSDLVSRPLRVFLCHSSGDKPTVRELYKRLDSEGWIDAWLDVEKLYPGQDWNLEIEKAVEASDIILVMLTNNSVSKEGYVQRELRMVLDLADYKPEGTLFIIPVRLEECEPPRRLRTWQFADYFPPSDRDRAYRRLLVSLLNRAKSLGIDTDRNDAKPANDDPSLRPVQTPAPKGDNMSQSEVSVSQQSNSNELDLEISEIIGNQSVDIYHRVQRLVGIFMRDFEPQRMQFRKQQEQQVKYLPPLVQSEQRNDFYRVEKLLEDKEFEKFKAAILPRYSEFIFDNDGEEDFLAPKHLEMLFDAAKGQQSMERWNMEHE